MGLFLGAGASTETSVVSSVVSAIANAAKVNKNAIPIPKKY
jgi:hypothetical protein